MMSCFLTITITLMEKVLGDFIIKGMIEPVDILLLVLLLKVTIWLEQKCSLQNPTCKS